MISILRYFYLFSSFFSVLKVEILHSHQCSQGPVALVSDTFPLIWGVNERLTETLKEQKIEAHIFAVGSGWDDYWVCLLVRVLRVI